MQPGTQCIATIYLIASNIQIICCHVSRSPHTNNQYESRILATKFCLFTFRVNIHKAKALNKGQSTSKNANITV